MKPYLLAMGLGVSTTFLSQEDALAQTGNRDLDRIQYVELGVGAKEADLPHGKKALRKRLKELEESLAQLKSDQKQIDEAPDTSLESKMHDLLMKIGVLKKQMNETQSSR